jgi:hypothetical protein
VAGRRWAGLGVPHPDVKLWQPVVVPVRTQPKVPEGRTSIPAPQAPELAGRHPDVVTARRCRTNPKFCSAGVSLTSIVQSSRARTASAAAEDRDLHQDEAKETATHPPQANGKIEKVPPHPAGGWAFKKSYNS